MQLPEGVFVDGKPLIEFLEDQERDEKSREIEEVRKQSEKYQRSTAVYSDEKKSKPDTRKVAKRVKRLTDREIRKEYGIMKKPFESRSSNVIWTIIEKGPVSVREIGEEINFNGKDNTLSAMVATVWARLGNMHENAAGIIDRKQSGGKYYYFKTEGVDVSVEAAIEKYKIAGSKQYKVTRRITETETQEPDLIHKIISKKSTALEIKVTGRVDVVFRFER